MNLNWHSNVNSLQILGYLTVPVRPMARTSEWQ
jgi:hypothetical protein